MARPIAWIWFLVCSLGLASAINHWILSGDRIIQKYDTPFMLREPDNLAVFLQQISYSEYVEKSYMELLRAHEHIVGLLHSSLGYGEELVNNAICAVDYYNLEKRMQYVEITSTYLQRFNLEEMLEDPGPTNGEPMCSQVARKVPSLDLKRLVDLKKNPVGQITIYEEVEAEVRDLADIIRRFAVRSLRKNPQSWKAYTLGSYYWRLKGNAQQAVVCATLGVALAPEEFKDVPLLSLGTTMMSGGLVAGAVDLLRSAVEHAPQVAENHLALGSALAMQHEFAEALQHFDAAERLDSRLLKKSFPVRNFVGCLDKLTRKTQQMYSYVENMKAELQDLKKLKNQISQKHEKLIQQQVPLNARNLDNSQVSEEFSRRGQYCSARTVANSEESVLFCDFYSDTHMRLESKDVDIDTLEREFRLGSEEVMRQVVQQFGKPLPFDKAKGVKTHADKD